ncbi:hypothetical protein [Agromyces sp. NPDC049794]|uniref:hypothetical protein n=1 Tax=unclassified Agromyces TaxID=2639701 RepID=UPI0033E66F8D
MSDINTPRDEHPQEGGDDREPPADMSSYNIEPPPAEGDEIPGVPDASRGLDDGAEDEPGANATGVGV